MSPADLELVKLAAQAAGLKLHVWGSRGHENVADITDPSNHKLWTPLLDDGDAFRLQVAVGMIVNAPTAGSANAGGHAEARFFDIVVQEPCEDWSDKARRAATRRAIVRCAAETITRSPT